MSNRTNDLTTGSIFQKLLKVALPVMGIQLMQMAYNLTDMFWLGRLGSDAVAASGTSGMYLWMSMAFLMLGRMGAEIGVSQNLGRGDPEAASAYSRTALTLNLVTGSAFALLLIVFADFFIGFFAIPEANVVADSVEYLRFVAPCIPFQFVGSVIAGTFSACGNTKIPLYINVVGLITNVVCDPLFIFTLDLGIAGAALATVMSHILVCALLLWVITRSKSRPFEKYKVFARFSRERVGRILRWSAPVGVESFCFTFLSMLISRMVASFGADAIAVQKLGSQIESLSWLISGGFASALTAFVGQNYGAGKWTRIRAGVNISYKAMGAYGAFVTVLLFFGGGFCFSLFVSEPQVIAEGASMIRFMCISMIASSLENVSLGAFRGIGRTMPPAIVSVSSNILRVPLCYFLSRTALGLSGVWLGIGLGSVLRGVWMTVWYFAAARRDPVVDVEPVLDRGQIA